MGKKRRPFSGFDVCIVLLVLLAAGAWFWMTNRSGPEERTFDGNRAVYYIEVNNLTIEQVEQVQVGAAIQEGSRHLPLGQVLYVDVRPFEARVDDWDSQTIRFEPVPERFTMILTVETLVEETEQDILTEGGFSIKGGRALGFTGPGFAFTSAIILGIERGV